MIFKAQTSEKWILMRFCFAAILTLPSYKWTADYMHRIIECEVNSIKWYWLHFSLPLPFYSFTPSWCNSVIIYWYLKSFRHLNILLIQKYLISIQSVSFYFHSWLLICIYLDKLNGNNRRICWVAGVPFLMKEANSIRLLII